MAEHDNTPRRTRLADKSTYYAPVLWLIWLLTGHSTNGSIP